MIALLTIAMHVSAVTVAGFYITCGYRFCCLAHTGKIKCWGDNRVGQAGQGDSNDITLAM